MMGKKQLNTTIDEALSDRLDALARQTGRSKSHYAAEFIERGLNDLEDHYLLNHALEEFYASDEDPVEFDEIDWDNLGQ
jgi:RHH-type rel operon transcriptional repressor/antitoxin RelB